MLRLLNLDKHDLAQAIDAIIAYRDFCASCAWPFEVRSAEAIYLRLHEGNEIFSQGELEALASGLAVLLKEQPSISVRSRFSALRSKIEKLLQVKIAA